MVSHQITRRLLPQRCPQLRTRQIPRFQTTRPSIRHETTTAAPPPPIPPTTIPPPPPQKRARNLLPLVYAAVFAFTGSTLGFLVAGIISPPPYPPPGSDEDLRLLALLSRDLDRVPLVIGLRDAIRRARGDESEIMGVMAMERRIVERARERDGEPALPREDAGWTELPSIPPRPGSLKEVMSGMGGMGVQRSFWNEKTEEFVTVTWIGGGLCGWPGLAHGGAMATMLAENSGRAVQWSGRKKVDAEEDPASIALTYLKPTNISTFYILRSQIEDPTTEDDKLQLDSPLPPSKDFTKKLAIEDTQAVREGRKPVVVHAALESLDGVVHVKATTTWNV